MSSLASSSSQPKLSTFEFDVFFLTLRDPVDRVRTYLIDRLRDVGAKTLNDDADEMKEKFPIQGMLEKSRLVVVVFTPEFVESHICLKRLANIMWHSKTMNKPVVNVFAGVSQEQVIEQLGDLDARESLAWALDFDLASTRAIAEAAFLSGFTLDQLEVLRWTISDDLRNKISRHMATSGLSILHDELFRDLPYHQVGLALPLRELFYTLGLKCILSSDDTIIVGIWGAGGVGKTTFAKAIYERLGENFEGKSFLSNMKDIWEKDGDKVLLKKQLISDISETELETNIITVYEQMEQLLCGRRVLGVFDDVTSKLQLEESRYIMKWCGEGSLVFITSRNEAIFDAFVDISYEMKRLNGKESHELFCLHAFKKFTPIIDFEDLSEQATEYCEGLPLALEVFGSLLHNRTKTEWEKIMNDMVGIPHGTIQNKLKISCDLLTDIEKDLFFNIARFYVGQSKHYVTLLLKSSRLPVEM